MPKPTPEQISTLLDQLRREASERHQRSMPPGGRLSDAQRARYRRMMKDYRSYVRMEDYPPRVQDLADRILSAGKYSLKPEETAYRDFCVAVTAMLADLYADLLDDAQG